MPAMVQQQHILAQSIVGVWVKECYCRCKSNGFESGIDKAVAKGFESIKKQPKRLVKTRQD